jgi:hypothetical protein
MVYLGRTRIEIGPCLLLVHLDRERLSNKTHFIIFYRILSMKVIFFKAAMMKLLPHPQDAAEKG